ncbi:hypothetical protein [Streptomyces sp. LN325]|uniref:hypothetical protein n=1 Tax=Streptomyces sp. LN325 TaxID=3112976 RepID=UPI003715F448
MTGLDGLLREFLGFLVLAGCLAHFGEPDQGEGLAGARGSPSELFGFFSVASCFPLGG